MSKTNSQKTPLRYSLAQAMATATRQPKPATQKFNLAEAMRRTIDSEQNK